MLELPPELWLSVFRFAVSVPDIMATQSLTPWEDCLWLNVSPVDQGLLIVSSLQNKNAICLVSRMWRQLGWQLLYEHICISVLEDGAEEDVTNEVGESIALLLGVLEKSKSVEGVHGKGHGWWTKRVDIPIQALHPTVFPKVLNLLDCCPNIEVISIHPIGEENPHDIRLLSLTLEARYLHSLRRVMFGTLLQGAGQNIPRDLLLPRIPYNTISVCVDAFTIQSPVDPFIFAHVTTLTIYLVAFITKGPAWQLPALRHLTIDLLTNDDVDAFKPFFTCHGPLLSSLTVFGSDRTSPIIHLDYFLTICTNLTHFITDPWDVKFGPLRGSYPKLTHLGVARNSHIDERGEQELGVLTPEFLAAFPSLAVLRTIVYIVGSEQLVPSIGEAGWEEWQTLVQHCMSRGVRVEDEKGWIITLPD